MIHSIITCDRCNPYGEIHASPLNGGAGIYEGEWQNAKSLGWKFATSNSPHGGREHLCPECADEEKP